MTDTDVKKLYVAVDGTVTLICPKCGSSRRESTEKYKEVKGPVKIECPCSHYYEVELEFRKSYRKETNIDGFYVRPSHSDEWGKMIIKNLSIGGCCFETRNKSTLVKGEEIKVQFTLNDLRGATIKKKAIVMDVKEKHVGCRFSEPPGSYDPDLGFYLKVT